MVAEERCNLAQYNEYGVLFSSQHISGHLDALVGGDSTDLSP
jgi:hypothetical protein